jgi:hypothetical protein
MMIMCAHVAQTSLFLQLHRPPVVSSFTLDVMPRSTIREEPIVSVNEAFELLLVALGDDPHAPVGCFRIIMGCTGIYSDAEDQHSRMKILPDAPPDPPPALLSAFMRFLTAYRTRDDVEALQNILFDCRCASGPPLLRDAHPSLHSQDLVYGEKSLNHLGDLVGTMLDSVRHALEKKQKLGSLYRTPNRDEDWPRVWEDLFPFDVSMCLHALGAWNYPDIWTLFDGPGPLFQLLTDTFGNCLVKGLLKSPTALNWIIKTEHHCEQSNHPAPNEERDITPIRITNLLRDLDGMTRVMRNINDLMFDDELLMWAQNVTSHYASENSLQDFVELCNDAIEMVRALPLRTTDFSKNGGSDYAQQTVKAVLETTSRTAARVWRLAPKQLKTYRPHLEVRKQADLARQLDGASPVMIVENHLAFRWKHRCHGPGCIMTAQDLRRSLKACAGCDRSRYCSRTCQRKAWDYQDGSHRHACVALRKLFILEKMCKTQAQIIEGLIMTTPRQMIDAANKHLDAIHKSQFKVIGRSGHRVLCHCADET